MKILYKFASRSRPKKFFECIENIYINKRHDNFIILASLDIDDVTMNNEDVIQKIKQYDKVYPIFGISTSKIGAINRDINECDYDFQILINTSDDMVFIQDGFDDIIRNDMKEHFPDTDGVLHYNDGNQKDNVMTMSIMGRKYYDRFGYIYHPDYKSVWCDVEQTEVAWMLGKHKYMGDEKVIFRHLHPAWGLAQYDEQYRKSENLNVWGEDLKTCIERKQKNYDLKEIVNAYKYPPSAMQQWIKDLNNARLNNGLIPLEFDVRNHGYSKNP